MRIITLDEFRRECWLLYRGKDSGRSVILYAVDVASSRTACYFRRYSFSDSWSATFLRQPGERYQQSRFTWGWHWEISKHSQVRKVNARLFCQQRIIHVPFGSVVETVESSDWWLQRQDRCQHQRIWARETAQAYNQASKYKAEGGSRLRMSRGV